MNPYEFGNSYSGRVARFCLVSVLSAWGVIGSALVTYLLTKWRDLDFTLFHVMKNIPTAVQAQNGIFPLGRISDTRNDPVLSNGWACMLAWFVFGALPDISSGWNV